MITDAACAVSDAGTVDGVRDILKSAPAGRLAGTCDGQSPYVGVVYNCSRAGAYYSNAHLDIASYREQPCQRMLKDAMQARAAVNASPKHDLSNGTFFILRDGKLHANIDKMKNAFTNGEWQD